MGKTLLRSFVVALLVLSVPVQAVASVVAGQCMEFGHHQDDGEAHTHAHDAAEGDHASHCGPCAACCASVSIAGDTRLPIPASPSYAVFLFSPSPPLGVQADDLYRPPLPL